MTNDLGRSAVRPQRPSEPEPSRHREPRRPKPVFVDRSGRRHRIVVASGAAAGVLVVLALGMLVAGLFGASPLPLPGLPDLVGPAPSQPQPSRPAAVTTHNPQTPEATAQGPGATPTAPATPPGA